MLATSPNVLNWYNSYTDSFRIPTVQDMVGPQICQTGSLVWVHGETISFYLNIPGGLIGLSPSSLPTITLLYNNGVEKAINANLFTDEISSGVYNLYGSVTLPSMAPRIYGLAKLKLINTSTMLTSSAIEVMTSDVANTCSIQCLWSNKKTKQGIRYPWIDQYFANNMRIRAVEIPAPSITDFSSYQAATTGHWNNYNVNQSVVRQFKTDLYDADTLRGIDFMLMHDEVLLNQNPVSIKDKLTYTFLRGPLSYGTFTVYDNTFAEPLMP